MFLKGILTDEWALFLGYSALEVTYLDDAVSIDQDFSSSPFPSDWVAVLVEGSNKRAALLAEKTLFLNCETG